MIDNSIHTTIKVIQLKIINVFKNGRIFDTARDI